MTAGLEATVGHVRSAQRPDDVSALRSDTGFPVSRLILLQSTMSIRFRHAGGYDTRGNSDTAREEILETEGVVAEVLPDTHFRVALHNGVIVSAYASGKMSASNPHSRRGQGSRWRCALTTSP